LELIKLGGEYWVSDGHRRVSVARILGIGHIRAEVTLLESASHPQSKTRIQNGSLKAREMTNDSAPTR
jgi:hypothetical protein